MLIKTRGIVLKVTNYAESSVVVQIYTEELGLQSYLVNGAKKPKARIHVNILQPLHLLDMVVYYKEHGGLQRIREAQQIPLLQDIPLNIVKSSITLFLNEVVYKVLRHQQKDYQLFFYLSHSIIWLDKSTGKLANFHLIFLIRLSRYLGFFPDVSDRPYLDLTEGIFTNTLPKHPHFIEEPFTTTLKGLITAEFDNMQQISMTKTDRRYLLEKILDFYRLHTDNFGEIHSMDILEEIFS